MNTGVWASKAIKEAKTFVGPVVEVASSKDKNFNYIPKGYTIPEDVDYFHFTSNNTIYGTEIFTDPVSPVPLICDMSSDILSRPVDVSKYDLIYAGAQKNLGPSGATLVIVKNAALGKVTRPIPTMLDYKVHIENESMFNTPATLPVFGCLQTLIWLKELGGIPVIEKMNKAKADALYEEIERNKLFMATVPDPADRSRMNINFVMNPEFAELEKPFITFAKSRGLLGLEGHRSVGGFRASLYNALPMESVQALIDAMREFEKEN
jgi:phosphoserine aminotransferase